MPISIDRFDEEPVDALEFREGTHPYRLLRFLAAHSEQAFTQTELKRPGSSAGASERHYRLEDRCLVRHRGRYWAIVEDDCLASYAAQTNASSTSYYRTELDDRHPVAAIHDGRPAVSTTDDYYGDEE